ncbi:hypothetical protein O181_025935 [Austropuccinia psidii MF-1]|uniref:Uncharacterized protein n=1 Tax=Austropuccinia psidii MF-1 TaxID=1389203 RepID=A0A9Q3H1P3_9BASI|nr:hypothetical protein [Austropuccinia psidii MF-1]
MRAGLAALDMIQSWFDRKVLQLDCWTCMFPIGRLRDGNLKELQYFFPRLLVAARFQTGRSPKLALQKQILHAFDSTEPQAARLSNFEGVRVMRVESASKLLANFPFSRFHDLIRRDVF